MGRRQVNHLSPPHIYLFPSKLYNHISFLLATAFIRSHTPLNEAQGEKSEGMSKRLRKKVYVFSLGRKIHGERQGYDVKKDSLPVL
jgi:hypothetical protein